MTRIHIGLGLALLVALAGGRAVWAHDDVSTYDDCILTFMQGIKSDQAALAVQRACRNKFPAASGGSVVPQQPFPLPGSQVPVTGTRPGTAIPGFPPGGVTINPEPQKVYTLRSAQLRDVEIGRDIVVTDIGAARRVEFFVQNNDRRFHLRQLEIEIDGTDLRSDRFKVGVNLPPGTGTRIVLQTPPFDSDRARFKVDRALATRDR